jgi:hypothetical protein
MPRQAKKKQSKAAPAGAFSIEPSWTPDDIVTEVVDPPAAPAPIEITRGEILDDTEVSEHGGKSYLDVIDLTEEAITKAIGKFNIEACLAGLDRTIHKALTVSEFHKGEVETARYANNIMDTCREFAGPKIDNVNFEELLDMTQKQIEAKK